MDQGNLEPVGVSLSTQSQPTTSPEQPVAKQEARLSADRSKATSKKTGGSPNVTPIVKQENPSGHKPDERKLAKFTFWLVVVGIIQAGILAATVWVIQRQVSTSRPIERAWVMAYIEHDSQKWADRKVHILQGSGSSGDSTSFYAVLVCRNEGRSPAWLGERRARFEIVSRLPPNPNLVLTELIEVSPTPLGSRKRT